MFFQHLFFLIFLRIAFTQSGKFPEHESFFLAMIIALILFKIFMALGDQISTFYLSPLYLSISTVHPKPMDLNIWAFDVIFIVSLQLLGHYSARDPASIGKYLSIIGAIYFFQPLLEAILLIFLTLVAIMSKLVTDESQYSIMSKKSSIQECVICKAEFLPQDIVNMLLCKHIFHKECISTWFRVKNACPLCNQNLCCAKSLHEVLKADDFNGQYFIWSK